MAKVIATIQTRRGAKSDFDPLRMKAGEIAVTTDGTNEAYVAVADGQTKEFLKQVKTVNGKSPDSNGAVSVTKSDVGLGNVNNTSDSSKPISTATQTALNQKIPLVQGSTAGNVPLLTAEGGLQDSGKQLTPAGIGAAPAGIGAGAHNSIYRGKDLGTSVTAAQYAAIQAGTFDDMYIGDYWVIGGVTYRIAAFDYYYRTGDTSCETHHATLVPDGNMYTHCMNDTNITTGGYVGSKMYTEGLERAKTTINAAFGSAHILHHHQYLQNAVTNGYPSGGSWYDSTVELMTEQNMYGGKVFGTANNGSAVPHLYTADKIQYPLFARRPDMISDRAWFWLRDVVSAATFAYVDGSGRASYSGASNALGVRPAFSIIG